MRPRQTAAGLGDPEVTIFRVTAQTVGFEILVVIMADGETLFRPRAFCNRRAARLGLELLSGCVFGGTFACGRFLLRGGLSRCPRRRLLLGHRRSPFLHVAGKR